MYPNVLIVDDDKGVRESFVEFYRDSYTVEAASNGEEALRLVKKSMPDLVILDIMLPGMDGIEVLKALRSQDSVLPIIMITGHDSIGTVRNAFRNGISDFFVKPFGWGEVEDVLQKYCVPEEEPFEDEVQSDVEKLITDVKERMIMEKGTLKEAKRVFKEELKDLIESKKDIMDGD